MAKIMIDPGHCEGNPNHGCWDYMEWCGMWELSNILKGDLERCGFEVALTRSYNEDPSLTGRGNAACGYDMLISEHSNAGGGEGCEVYRSIRIPEDENFAADLANAVSAVLGSNSRGAKVKESTNEEGYDYYTVIGYAVAVGCPHVFICENGFHDNEQDCAVLNCTSGLVAIAEAQARVICSHFGVAYVGEDTPAPAPAPVPTPEPAPAVSSLVVGNTVRVRDGVDTFANGTGMASFVRSSVLYVRQLGDGTALVSTQAEGDVTGWVNTADLVRDDGSAVVVEPTPEPAPEPAALAEGDTVRIRDGVDTFANGTGMASFIRESVLYVRQIGDGKVLISTQADGDVTGWVNTDDVVRA